MKSIIITLMLALVSFLAFTQNVIIFQPGPGQNDGSDEGGLNGGKESFIYDEQYSVNYGNNTIYASNPISTCNFTNLRAFIKFDVSSLPEQVDSVFLCLYLLAYNNYCYANCDNSFDLRYVTTAWNEMDINWNNQPPAGDPFSDTVRIAFPFGGGMLKLNITEAYRNWKSGAVDNQGFMINPLDGWCNNACVSFAGYSSDYADDTTMRPYLEIFSYQPGGIEINGAVTNMTAFPNPADELFSLQITSTIPEEFTLRIFDITCKERIRKTIAAQAGFNLFTIPVSNLPTGAYVYTLTGNKGSASGRFLVAH